MSLRNKNKAKKIVQLEVSQFFRDQVNDRVNPHFKNYLRLKNHGFPDGLSEEVKRRLTTGVYDNLTGEFIPFSRGYIICIGCQKAHRRGRSELYCTACWSEYKAHQLALEFPSMGQPYEDDPIELDDEDIKEIDLILDKIN